MAKEGQHGYEDVTVTESPRRTGEVEGERQTGRASLGRVVSVSVRVRLDRDYAYPTCSCSKAFLSHIYRVCVHDSSRDMLI